MSKTPKLRFHALAQNRGHWIAREKSSTYLVGLAAGGFIAFWERPTDNGTEREPLINHDHRLFSSPTQAMDACDAHHRAQGLKKIQAVEANAPTAF